MAQVGRISGPLLVENLQRQGAVNPASQANLAFRNTLSDPELLFINVNDGKIGINHSAATNDIHTSGITKSTNLLSTTASIADFEIENNNLNVATGDINLNASNAIVLSNFETDNIHITDNTVSTYRSNANIDVTPNGTGSVDVQSNLNVFGNLSTPQNLTFDGDITFGNDSNDTVSLNADINTDVVPDQTGTYDLGYPNKRWLLVEAQRVNGQIFVANTVEATGAALSLRQGNIFYVAENGDDTNVGDHPNGPFKTLKHALDAADSSIGGPVTIHVFAGGYEEELPLVVPSNVSIIGEDYRNTFIRPQSSDQSKDIFHLNGETTIQNLTITDFYYDSGNDTGYAFRFAPNTTITSRSPYVQNVTVITKGTTTSASDPRGFASGDAGKGALVDGADVLSTSEEASMLFHSATFITPGVDAITMTNGVRVEWLNSFTYFANRGLYAVDGVTGHLSTDGSTIKYGAEVRAIGSANVYGNYGAVADGADTLMYLIQHNLAYIGVGKDITNDAGLAIQNQEITELNSGKIYYSTTDHLGNFRVGDQFFIDLETGQTSIQIDPTTGSTATNIIVRNDGDLTRIEPNFITTGDFLLQGNTASTLQFDFNITAANEINLNDDTYISKDLDITGNLTFDGSLNTFGNQATDTVKLNVDIDQNLYPNITNVYKLGSATKRWTNIWSSEANLGDILIKDNFITTDISNANLELKASGTGIIHIPNNDVTFRQETTVGGNTTLQGTQITGTLTHTGDLAQIGDYQLTNLTLTKKLDISSQAQFEEILFDGNVVTTTTSNTDLELRASGTGQIKVPYQNVTVPNNLNSASIIANNINVDKTLSLNEIVITDSIIEIDDNFIATTISNSNLELRANGTGNVVIDNNDISITQNLTVVTAADLDNTVINGLITHTGNKTQVGNNNLTGNLIISDKVDISSATQFEDFKVAGNLLQTTIGNNDLQLVANGTGDILIPTNNVTFGQDTSVGTLNTNGIIINSGLAIEKLESSTDIQIFDNVITTTNSNSNLELRANNTGSVYLQDIEFTQGTFGTTATPDSTLNDITLDVTETLIIDSTGGIVLPNGTTAEANDVPGDLRFNTSTNVFEGYGLTSTISLNGIFSSDRQTSVTAHPTNNTLFFNVDGTQVATASINGLSIHGLQVDDVNINDNQISTNVSNSDLELRTAGTGKLVNGSLALTNNVIENNKTYGGLVVKHTGTGYAKFPTTLGVVFPFGSTAERPTVRNPVVAETRFNTDDQIMETWDGNFWIPSGGPASDVISEQEFQDLLLEYTLIFG